MLHYVFRYAYRYHEAGVHTDCWRSKCAYLRLHLANHVPPLVCGVIALLLANRALNQEATEVFYGVNGFEFADADALE
jgi:hypothetical protein